MSVPPAGEPAAAAAGQPPGPVMNGRELAGRLREFNRALKVLLVSGYADPLSAGQGLQEDGIQFLPKPYSAESLLARTRALLDASG